MVSGVEHVRFALVFEIKKNCIFTTNTVWIFKGRNQKDYF